MIDFNQKGKVVITCKDRFSTYLESELKALGFKLKGVFRTHVELYASLNECVFLNLHLRTSSHVLFEIRSFYLRHADDIYRRIKSIPWEDYLEKDAYFSVNSHVDNDSVDNPLFVNVRIKDAIVDRFREKTGVRPDSGSDYEGAVFQLYWKETQASLFINTSGDTLAKHGYRKIPGQAPMLEALAAASIYATSWDENSHFINPMCGSGTLAIEAALMATNRYPGLFRDHYSFQFIKGYSVEYYDQQKEALLKKIKPKGDFKIIASDISEQAILISKENAAVAGVEDLIDFELADFEDTTIPQPANGVVMINPEYGERLGGEDELEATYKRIGDFFKKKCSGYLGYIFTGNLELAKKIGLKASRRIEFYNGTIDCRLLKYELYSGKKEE
jgi:putative N6-adenine-specific DNA methylase